MWEMIMFVFCRIAEDFLPQTNKGLVGCGGVALEFSLCPIPGVELGHRGGKLSHNAALFFHFATHSFDNPAACSPEASCWPESVFCSIFIEPSFRMAGPQ